MCGIIGIITNQSRATISEPLQRGLRALAHRGPDDQGVEFISDERDGLTVAFAQSRLAILDLSPAGHQPMRDDITGNWITYNGEVFNFRQAREKLIQRGLRFQSESDTEVLLKGYGLLGDAAITDWRGMFAFGFWHARARQLTLLRDRLGIKPLYYFHDGQTLLFASELRALLATGLVPRRLSAAALDSYLAFGSVQQPLTIIENVYALLPGHKLNFKDGQLTTTPYWELRADAVPEPVKDAAALRAEISALLHEAVRLRLVADVPVGVFLSGGIDSSAIVALLRRATKQEIKSFSVCFREQEFSEQSYAETVARQYQTQHTNVLLTEGEILAQLPHALRAMDQPSIDGINTYIVSQAAADAGLKVALSGLGGDEVFAGYRVFRTVARDEQLRAVAGAVPFGVRNAAAAALGAFASGQRASKLSALLRSEQFDEHSVRLHRQLFSPAQRRALQHAKLEHTTEQTELAVWTERQLALCAQADPINQASALELGGYLGNTLLRDTDAMSMAHSLEVRVPLLDHLLVERMLTIPGAFKLRAEQPKWLLTNAAPDLPREIIDRPKRGFELPFKVWLQGKLRTEAEAVLQSSRLTSLLHAPEMQTIWRGFLAGNISWSRVWSFYVLGQWLEVNL